MLPSPSAMHFDTWTVSRVDTLRLRRMFVGSIVGSILVVLGLAFVILTSKGAAAEEEEEEGPIEVALAEAPEPEPPPPPPPAADKPKPAPKPRISTPAVVSDEKLVEKDPTPSQLQPEEDEHEAPPAVASAAPPPPVATVVKAKPKPQAKKPVRLTEDMPRPVQTFMKTPEYPPDAKANGIEGVVIVKYIVAEDGSVRDAKVLKGPPELAGACLAAVKTWRFQPMIVDGAAISFVKIARFPFRIR